MAIAPGFDLAPLSGVLNHPTRFSGGRSPSALNDHRLPSDNPPGWLPFELGECPHSRKWRERALECGHSGSGNPKGMPDGSRRSPRVSWGGDLRATVLDRTRTPAGCQSGYCAGGRSGTPPGCSTIRRAFPVVVPPSPRTTTGYPLPTLRVGLRRLRVLIWCSPDTVQPVQLLDSSDVTTWIVGSKTDRLKQYPLLPSQAHLLHFQLR